MYTSTAVLTHLLLCLQPNIRCVYTHCNVTHDNDIMLYCILGFYKIIPNKYLSPDPSRERNDRSANGQELQNVLQNEAHATFLTEILKVNRNKLAP
jgi:hypothetical protein